MTTKGVYIHLTWEGYKNSNSSVESINLQSQTRQTYLQAAASSQGDILDKMGMSASNLNKLLTDVEKLKDNWTTPAGKTQINKVLMEGIDGAIKAGLNGGKGSNSIGKDSLSVFNSLNSIGEILNTIPTLDEKLSKYLKSGESSAGDLSKVLSGNSFTMVNYNNSITSSLQKTAQLYGKSKNDKKQLQQINSMKNDMIKELVGSQIEKAIKKNLLDPLGVSDPSLTKSAKDEKFNKSNNSVTVGYTNTEGVGSINLDLTVKDKPSIKGATSVFSLPNRMQETLQKAALMDSAYEYGLLNLLAHNHSTVDIGRFIAAKATIDTLPKNGSGLNFIAGFDRIISVQDLFRNMAITQPEYSFNGSGIGPGRRIPGDPATQALIRSSIQLKKFLSLSASLNNLI